MRMRSRTSNQPGGSRIITETSVNSDTGQVSVLDKSNSQHLPVKAVVETMSDDIDSRSRIPNYLRYRLEDFRFRGIRAETLARPVHKCFHTKKRISYPESIKTVYNDIHSGPITRSTTGEFTGASYAEWISYELFGDPYFLYTGSDKWYTSSPFLAPDWFHLLDRFNEACDSLIPSSLILGEDLVESDIFIDAIKTVINPTNAIKIFIKKILKHYGKRALRGKRLGEITKLALKDAANLDLSYNFGVKPAIKDIRDSLDAHKTVSERLAYLHRHAGGFVPIRVRQDLGSDIDNFDFPADTTFPTAYIRGEGKYTRSVISCWGRVRNDINLGRKWGAYIEYFGLNKVIGLGWELIPFSFVVDWFTNAQERINSLTRISLGSPFTEFRSLTASYKENLIESIWVLPNYHDSALNLTLVKPDKPHRLMSVETTAYNRYTSIPETSGVVDLSTLGLFQAITGGALIVQRGLR